MAYEAKPGSFSLFKNERKSSETHADYTGSGIDLNGKEVWVNAWIKKGNGKTFMSCSMKLKEEDKKASKPVPQKASFELDDEDLPF